MDELKQLLLNLKNSLNEYIFEDNSFLDSYCNLIKTNLNTPKQKFKTNLHHFIPICYYKSLYPSNNENQIKNIADKDSNNILVNLSYGDHILAHYYLCLFCVDKYLYSNLNVAFCSMVFQKSNLIDFNPKKSFLL